MGDGRVALITGGASGIGRALGEALAERGVRVVLADRQRELAETVAVEIRRKGRSARAFGLDVRDEHAFAELVDEVQQHYGRIDLFFNNAGIGVGGPAESFEASDWYDVLDVNVTGVVHGIRAVYPLMIRQGHGHIINTASIAGLITTSNMTSYTASKHAVVGLSKGLRVEARRHGVKVSVLCPGFVRTAILTGGEFGRMRMPHLAGQLSEMIERTRPMDPAVFAQKALKAIERNEAIIVFPRWWRALWLLDRISPTVSLALWTALNDRTMREAERLGVPEPEAPSIPRVRGPRAQA